MGRALVSLASLGFRPEAIAGRFWAKVAVSAADDCWPWTGALSHCGYGLFHVGSRVGRTKRTVTASRIAFELHHGRPPAGLALHRCDNRPCCNPAHLFEGDDAANTLDRCAKGRSSKGSSHGSAKLTESLVREARDLFGALNVVQLAARYGVSHPTMWKAVHGRTWRHV